MIAEPTIIIIGAGPMGLVTAYLFAKRGYKVQVFEADDRIGGMSAHFDFDGLTLERYYHFVCKTDAPLIQLLKQLDLEDELHWKPTRMGFYYRGELHEWSRPDALFAFPYLRKREKIRYALNVLRARTMRDWRKLDQITATRWLKDWLGESAYELLWQPSFALKFHDRADEISAAWIATRIRRVALSRRNAFQEEMGYLSGGSERLLSALRARIEASGGEIKLKSAVRQVLTKGRQVTGVETAQGRVLADVVISTVPIQYLPAMVPAFSVEERNRIQAIDNIGVACVVLKLREPYSPYFWININDPDIPVPGAIEYTNLNPLAEHVLYVPYYLTPDHPKWSWGDEDLVEEAASALRTMRPLWDPDQVLASRVSRYRYAQPICEVGFGDRIPPIETSIRGFFMADTSYCYPEDRSISESIGLAYALASAAESSLS
ncbi:MAG: NAD(P)/FAD-dependent oxidoreductase [Deltaproteobacteria bacterium]|nr:MAG: NAD(P)/FAD-dependent oxidoreductase [Deltaproteobacteria bacterium]